MPVMPRTVSKGGPVPTLLDDTRVRSPVEGSIRITSFWNPIVRSASRATKISPFGIEAMARMWLSRNR